MIKRKIIAAIVAATAVFAAGCINTNILLDHAWFDNPASGGSPSASSIHVYDIDGGTTESCSYPADFGCQPTGTRNRPQPLGPNGENDRMGREALWVNLSAADTPCTHQDANGQPGHGWPGYGGFTPPSDNCIAHFQAQITDDPNDSSADEPTWNICAYPPTSGTPPTTASGAHPRDCHNGGTGTLANTSPTNVNTWTRSQFVGSNPSQGWSNTAELIMAVRDFYLVQITDTQIQPPTNPQRNGYASCISIYDFDAGGITTRVRLQRLCP